MRFLLPAFGVLAVTVAGTAHGIPIPTFSPTSYPLPGTVSTSFSGVAIGDLDDRHGPDLVVPQHNGTTVCVLLNQGDGTFAPATDHASCGGDYAAPQLGEFTGDGKLDLLQPCAGTGDFEILPGDGAGGFGSPAYYTLDPSYYGIVAGVDGQRDLVFPTGPSANWTMCFIALADLAPGPLMPTCGSDHVQGDFTAFDVFAAGASPPSDRDQLFGVADAHDIFVIGYDPQGVGGWSYSTRFVGPATAREVAGGDLNGDGISDVLVANDGSLSVFLAAATTGGIAPGAQGVSAGTSLEVPYVLRLADIDGDGRLDAIVGGTDAQNHPEFAVMLGRGDGTFEAPARIGTEFGPDSTAWWMNVADLNGDGKADVVIVNGDERMVRVFLNTTIGGAATTTTTLPAIPCGSVDECLAVLAATLPDPSSAANKKLRRIAVKLQHLDRVLAGDLGKAAAVTGKKQAKLYARARNLLPMLVAKAQKADQHGTLGAPLVPVEAAADALRNEIP